MKLLHHLWVAIVVLALVEQGVAIEQIVSRIDDSDLYLKLTPDQVVRLYLEEEVPIVRTGAKTRDVEENTILFTKALERYILKYPDQWFWYHQRWKTLPYCVIPQEHLSE